MTARAFAILMLLILGLVAGACLAMPFVITYQMGAAHGR